MKKNKYRKISKQILMYLICLCISFAFLYAQPKQKAHAIFPLIAGQFIKKSASKALAGVLVRQGAKAGTVVTMKRAVQIAGSRMTPAQYAMFTGGLKYGVKSLDNKYVKIILGAELAVALGTLTSDMHEIATTGDLVEYNYELSDGVGRSFAEVVPAGNLAGFTQTNPAKFMVFPQMQFPGVEIVGKVMGTTFYTHLAYMLPLFDNTPGTIEAEPYGSMGVLDTTGVGILNTVPIPRWDLMYVTGINVYPKTSVEVIVNFFGQTGAPDGVSPLTSKHMTLPSPSGGNPGHLFLDSRSLTNAEWNEYYTILTGDEHHMTTAQINDFSKDETFIEQYPLTNPSTLVPNEFEYQIPNPDYWDLPGMEEAYYEQLQNFPGQTTVVDPNNYPTPGTEQEKDIYGDGLPYSEGTYPTPDPPPVTDPAPAPSEPIGTPSDPINTRPNSPWRNFWPLAVVLALLDLLIAIIMYLIRMFNFIVMLPFVESRPINNSVFEWWRNSTWLGIQPYFLVLNLATFFASFKAYQAIRRLFP